MTLDERRKYARDRAQRIRDSQQFLVEMVCPKCGRSVSTKKYLADCYLKKGLSGPKCKVCLSRQSADTLKKLRDSQTPDQKSEMARRARYCASKENMSNGVRKQWATIRSDPELFEKMSSRRSERSKKVWENYSDEQRNRIIVALVSGNNCGRSKVSEKFKQAMVQAGIYDGFESEQVFHGFIPDEINHSLKIIVEVFGDLYHCNPRKYKDETVYVRAIQRTVGEQWLRDRRKLACYYKYGYTVVIVWEKDIYNDIGKQTNRVKNEVEAKKKMLCG